jgi:hypothetical protein
VRRVARSWAPAPSGVGGRRWVVGPTPWGGGGPTLKLWSSVATSSFNVNRLDVYADLFDDDLAGVADKLDESVGKMWARGVNLDGQQT